MTNHRSCFGCFSDHCLCTPQYRFIVAYTFSSCIQVKDGQARNFVQASAFQKEFHGITLYTHLSFYSQFLSLRHRCQVGRIPAKY